MLYVQKPEKYETRYWLSIFKARNKECSAGRDSRKFARFPVQKTELNEVTFCSNNYLPDARILQKFSRN